MWWKVKKSIENENDKLFWFEGIVEDGLKKEIKRIVEKKKKEKRLEDEGEKIDELNGMKDEDKKRKEKKKKRLGEGRES